MKNIDITLTRNVCLLRCKKCNKSSNMAISMMFYEKIKDDEGSLEWAEWGWMGKQCFCPQCGKKLLEEVE